MKRKGFLIGLLLLFSLVLLAGCQPEVETSRPPVAPTPETVDKAAIEAELLRIENDWPRVLRERDAAAVRRVEADDVVLVYPDGNVGNKEQDAKDMESGNLSADSVEMADLKVNVLDKDAAVVSGRTIVKNGKYKMPNGQTIDISGEYRFIDTFARRNGEWKLVAGASVPVRQPSGSPSPTASPAAKASPTMRPSPAPKASPAVSPASTP